MPRGRDLSWAMKTAIWDLASKEGLKLEAILRDLEHLCRHDMPLEGEVIPDARTVKAVIKELQELKVEVLATLPRHIWHLRDDYNDIKDELEKPQVTVERGASPQSVVWEGLIDLVAQLQGNLYHISVRPVNSETLSPVSSKTMMTVMSR